MKANSIFQTYKHQHKVSSSFEKYKIHPHKKGQMNSLESSPELGVHEFPDKVVKLTITKKKKKVLSELRITI